MSENLKYWLIIIRNPKKDGIETGYTIEEEFVKRCYKVPGWEVVAKSIEFNTSLNKATFFREKIAKGYEVEQGAYSTLKLLQAYCGYCESFYEDLPKVAGSASTSNTRAPNNPWDVFSQPPAPTLPLKRVPMIVLPPIVASGSQPTSSGNGRANPRPGAPNIR
ncbi:hypothetical protein P154DRAFT_575780 [Amniculicola lignicola CBS 123094]|uniref:Uncharacterized protein n=1 Tax=Amniculicola lignicola CBS 123094 TaxID=1392246 RepID=A0A6A5WIU9_9PLEO|nr:hypothetical protein P154DRAFT_575780 [Amniculicola lignicola CBS 123094]